MANGVHVYQVVENTGVVSSKFRIVVSSKFSINGISNGKVGDECDVLTPKRKSFLARKVAVLVLS